MFRSTLFIGLIAGCGSWCHAAYFAAEVVSYHGGPGIVTTYANPAAALGSPDGVTGEGVFPNVLGPFSPAYSDDEIVQIGEGGHLTLRLSHYAVVGAGLELGVITNVGLIDNDWPNGATAGTASTFGADDATVEVSENGLDWVSLGTLHFNLPAIYYLNAGPYDTAAPASPVLADFGLPFTGSLSDFDNKPTYADVVSVFGGSGGGTWLDLGATGLSQVGYVRFSVLDDGDAGTALSFELDAVSIATAALGAPVPEPASAIVLLLAAACARRRARTVA